MKILAIDPATNTGISFEKDGEIIAESWNLGIKGVSKERRLHSFYQKLCSLLSEKTDITHIVYERPSGSHFVGVQFHANLEGIILLVCADFDRIPYPISAKSVKKFVTGNGNATKKEMVHTIRERKYKVIDDNEADAIGMYLFGQFKLNEECSN